MKLVFEGKTLHEINQQVLTTARELEGGEPSDVRPTAQSTAFTEATKSTGPSFPLPNHGINEQATQVVHGQPRDNKLDIAQHSELDAAGFPHDARIHSANREKTVQGVWRRRRGVDATVVEMVEQELKNKGFGQPQVAVQSAAKTVPPFGSMPAEQYQQHVAPPQAPLTAPVTAQVAIAPMPTTAERVVIPTMDAPALAQIPSVPPTPPPPMTVPNGHTLESFKQNLVHILTKLSNEGKINADYINQLKAWFGLEVYEFVKDDAKCAQLFDVLAQQGFVVKV